jgi:hypothetical protein
MLVLRRVVQWSHVCAIVERVNIAPECNQALHFSQVTVCGRPMKSLTLEPLLNVGIKGHNSLNSAALKA